MYKKIDIYYRDSKGQHHYVWSTNMYKLVREAVARAKEIFANPTLERLVISKKFGEEIDINRIYGRFDRSR